MRCILPSIPIRGQLKTRDWRKLQAKPTAGTRCDGPGTKWFPGSDPGQLILPGRSPGRVRGCYSLASKVPGKDASRGGTVLPRRVVGGAALAGELPRRVAEAPSFLHRPDQALMKRDDGAASVSDACQVYLWRRTLPSLRRQRRVAARRAPLQGILRTSR